MKYDIELLTRCAVLSLEIITDMYFVTYNKYGIYFR